MFKILCSFSIFRTLVYSELWYIQNQGHTQNSGIFKNLAYSEPDAVQNPGIFKTRSIFRTLIYPETCQASMMERFGKIVNGYNYFRSISFSGSLLFETNITIFEYMSNFFSKSILNVILIYLNRII